MSSRDSAVGGQKAAAKDTEFKVDFVCKQFAMIGNLYLQLSFLFGVFSGGLAIDFTHDAALPERVQN